MNVFAGAFYLLFLLFLIILQGFYAYQGGLLSLRQMRRHGVRRGLPFLWHSGMWVDVLIAFWTCYVVSAYSAQWSMFIWIPADAIIMAVSLWIGMYWQKQAEADSIPEAHTTTLAGPLHIIYMSLVLPVILLFYFTTKNVPPGFVILTSVGLWLHVVVAHHFIPALFGSEWYPRRPWQMKSFFITIFVLAALLTGASWWCISRS